MSSIPWESLDASCAVPYFVGEVERYMMPVPPEVALLIAEFAVNAPQIGQFVDFRDEFMDVQRWTVGQIVDVKELSSILLHFPGWKKNFDLWIDLPSDRVQPLLSKTALELSNRVDMNKTNNAADVLVTEGFCTREEVEGAPNYDRFLMTAFILQRRRVTSPKTTN
eukprot:TRINITY_DN6592_c0_g1_i1.p1 TRINITY_DN6592_c0_g1~~TRINITY_DN6592_c0_g1_i1.p1  ORF type:complete len:166 (-),score=29.31 TRINITY_DN6592_c0_g1_i1:92-589(-)